MKLYRNIPLWAVALVLPWCGVQSAYGVIPQVDQQQQDPLQGALTDPLDDPLVEAEPLPVIDKEVVGWRGASLAAGTDRLSDTIRANWVMISKVDSLDGRVAVPGEYPIDGISVFLLRDGIPVGEAVTNSLGEFQFEGATPGPYAILCFSAETIVAFGFNAVEYNPEAVGVPLTIHARPVAGRDNNILVSRFIRDYSPSVVFRSYGTYDIGEEATDPVEYYGWAGLKNLNQNTVPATTISARAVPLVDGKFVGRVHQIHNRTGRPVEIKKTQVHLIQDGQIVAETTVDNLGVFKFEGIEPGSYGLVATGSDGIGAVGLELVAGSAPAEKQSGDDRFDIFKNASAINMVTDGGQSVSMTLVDPESVGWIHVYLEEQQYRIAMGEPLPGMTPPNFNPNLPYDYFSYTGAGGGGLGGQLVNWIIPVGIVAAIVSDNDSTGGGIPLVSPFFP